MTDKTTSFHDRVTVSIDNHIAHVEMIRSDKMNALDKAMFDGLIESAAFLEDKKDVRVVVLSGQGRAFCAGLDMANFAAMADAGANTEADADAQASGNVQTDGDLITRTHGDANNFQQVCQAWHNLPMPVIAAAHNVCLGGGLHVFLGCDIRYAAPETRFSIMEIRWGLIPDMGSTPLLPHLLRRDVIKELTFTGRIFETTEAKELGIVTQIHADPLAAAMETAALIATKNPIAMRANKMIINKAAYLSPADALMLESEVQQEIIGSKNQTEAVMAELEGRPAKFSA